MGFVRGCLKTLPFTPASSTGQALSLSKGRGAVHGSTSSPRTISGDLLDVLLDVMAKSYTPRGDFCASPGLTGKGGSNGPLSFAILPHPNPLPLETLRNPRIAGESGIQGPTLFRDSPSPQPSPAGRGSFAKVSAGRGRLARVARGRRDKRLFRLLNSHAPRCGMSNGDRASRDVTHSTTRRGNPRT